MDVLRSGPQFLGLVGFVKRWIDGAAAKVVARRWGVDTRTVENVRRDVVSANTLVNAARAEGWRFWLQLGEAVIGTTYADHLQSELEAIAHDRLALEQLDQQLRTDLEVARTRRARGGDIHPLVAAPTRVRERRAAGRH